jgi:hypothetical protein
MSRWAKKYWFNDFGAYTQAEHDETVQRKTRELVAAG